MLRQQLLDSDHQDGEGGLEVGERTRKWLRPAG